MIQVIIFDFDGLILDTELPDFQSWQEIYQAYGCSLPFSVWAPSIGSMDLDLFNPYDYLEAQLGRPVDRAEIRAKRKPHYEELMATQSVLPGVRDYIADARRLGLKLGLASSSSRAWVTGYLSQLGLNGNGPTGTPTFNCICCGDEVERTKPDPALYCLALNALGLRPDQAIALEDSLNGVVAAKRAGLFCVVVPSALTRRFSFDQADLRLDSLADLPLEKLLWEVERNGR